MGSWLVGPKPIERRKVAAKTPDAFVGIAQVAEVEAGSHHFELVLRVDRGLLVNGQVLGPDGEPVPDCEVSAHMQDTWVMEHDKTDESGHFAIGPLPAGVYALKAGGMFGKYAASPTVSARAGDSDIVLRVALGASLAVRVVDANGDPRTCDVVVSPSGDEFGWLMSTAQKGATRFDGLSPGTYSVRARTSDGLFGQRLRLVLHAGETLEPIEVRLDLGAKLTLRYVGDQSAASFEILSAGETLAGDGLIRGTDSLQVVPAGTIEVRWRQASSNDVVSRRVTLTAGEERELVWNGKP